jgi:hypothetical protein
VVQVEEERVATKITRGKPARVRFGKAQEDAFYR